MVNSMSDFILCADPHLGQYLKTRPSRGMKLIRFFCENLKDLRKVSPNLIIAGDLVHSAQMSTEEMLYVRDQVVPVFETFDSVSVIVGNHEALMGYGGSQRTILELIFGGGNVRIIHPPFEIITNDDLDLLCIPHQHDLESIWTNASQAVKSDRTTFVIGHLTPHEIFSFAKFDMSKVLEEFNKVGNVPYVLLGDYHTPIDMTLLDKKLISIGSMYYWNIEDIRKLTKETRKRVLHWNGKTMESIVLNLPRIHSLSFEDDNDFQKHDFSSINPENDVVYIKSKKSLDLTSMNESGFDVYHEYVKGGNQIAESLKNMEVDRSSLTDVKEFWGQFSKSIPKEHKDVSDFIFENSENDPQKLIELVIKNVR